MRGEIDLHTAPQLHAPLADLDVAATERVVVDLSACGFIDSTGLGVLVAAAKRLRLANPPAVVCAGEVHRALLMTGLDRVFRICDTLEEALAVASPVD